jgi:hypothetical protein
MRRTRKQTMERRREEKRKKRKRKRKRQKKEKENPPEFTHSKMMVASESDTAVSSGAISTL